jgi:hypothetical protein
MWKNEEERQEYLAESKRRLAYRRALSLELQHRVGITVENFLDVPGMVDVYEAAIANRTHVEDLVSSIDFNEERFDFLF